MFFYVDISNWHLSIAIDKVSVYWQNLFFCVKYFRWNYSVDVPSIQLTNSWQSLRIFQTVDEVEKIEKIDEIVEIDEIDDKKSRSDFFHVTSITLY